MSPPEQISKRKFSGRKLPPYFFAYFELSPIDFICDFFAIPLANAHNGENYLPIFLRQVHELGRVDEARTVLVFD